MEFDISFKDINDKFSYGKLGEFDVIIMKSNGYINATKFISKYSKIDTNQETNNVKLKKFGDWLRLDRSIELIEQIKLEIDQSKSPEGYPSVEEYQSILLKN
jgi:hypothetical protein